MSRTLLATALSAVVGLAGAGCGDNEAGAGRPAIGAPSTGAPSTTSPTQSQSPTPTSESPQDDRMRINITIGDQRFQATLSDSAAARDLAAQLPVTIDMADHGGVEKTGALPSPLSLDGQPEGADPDVGDLGYYAPGNDLVLYYGDQAYYSGIVVLGRLDGTAAQRISAMNGPVTATIEA
ncbi:MAG: cyclophilin-like fold protein [Jatrophihabitantaceae bacterium]